MKSKNLLVGLLLVLSLILTSCGSNKEKNSSKIKIGINQLVEHVALDDARKGFEDRIKELGIDAEIIYKNAQGEIPNALSISNQFVDSKVDLIYAIATPSAQVSKQAVDERADGKIPVIFSAVSNPVESGLIDSFEKVGGNVTGVSDQGPVKEQVMMFKKIKPEAKVIGTIYSTKESNSEMQLIELEKIAKELGYTVEKMGVSEISEIPTGLDVLLPKVDVVYLLSDNLIASSIELVSKRMIDAKIPSVSAEESQVKGGALATKASSYYEMGVQAANMAKKVLVDKVSVEDIPAATAENLTISHNKDTAKELNLDIEEILK